MCKNIIKAGIVGGLIVFLWSWASWMFLPWHMSTMKKFNDETSVATALKAQATEKGMYFIPYIDHSTKESVEAGHEKLRAGPFAFMVLHPGGKDPSMAKCMIIGLLTQILAAAFIFYLLLKSTTQTLCSRLCYVNTIVAVASLLCIVPEWNYWGFTCGFVLLTMADLFIGWTLASFAFHKLLPKT